MTADRRRAIVSQLANGKFVFSLSSGERGRGSGVKLSVQTALRFVQAGPATGSVIFGERGLGAGSAANAVIALGKQGMVG